MTDDVAGAVAALQAQGIEIARPISDQGWGLLTGHHPPRQGGARPLPAPAPDRGAADLSLIHPRPGRSRMDGGTRDSKTFVSQSSVLCQCASGVTFRIATREKPSRRFRGPSRWSSRRRLEGSWRPWKSHDLAREPLPQQRRATGAFHAVGTAWVGTSARGGCRSESAICCGRLARPCCDASTR